MVLTTIYVIGVSRLIKIALRKTYSAFNFGKSGANFQLLKVSTTINLPSSWKNSSSGYIIWCLWPTCFAVVDKLSFRVNASDDSYFCNFFRSRVKNSKWDLSLPQKYMVLPFPATWDSLIVNYLRDDVRDACPEILKGDGIGWRAGNARHRSCLS